MLKIVLEKVFLEEKNCYFMKTIVAFLSRSHGLNVLNSLVTSKNFKIIKVFTHKLNPKSQDLSRSERNDYYLFEKICLKNNIILETVDSINEKVSNIPECDYIIEVSWRYLIKEDIVKKAKKAAFGIHRGKLPNYAGSEPIKQAIQNNENEIYLSAHNLAPVIDGGETYGTITHPTSYNKNFSIEENIQRIRIEITPLFSILMLKTLNNFETQN